CLEPFVGSKDGFQYEFYIVFGFKLLFGMKAVVVIFGTGTIFFVKLFTKIVKDKFPSVHRSFSVSYYFLQKLHPYFLFGYRFSVKEFFKLFNVFISVKSYA